MQIQVYSGSLTRLASEVLVVSCFEDVRPLRGLAAEVDWIYGGALSRVLMQGHFSGHSGEVLLFATEGKLKIPKVVLLGQGKSCGAGQNQIQGMYKVFRTLIKGLNVSDCAIEMHPVSDQNIDTLDLLGSFLEGWPAPENEARPLELKLLVEDREKASVLQKVRNWIPHWKHGKNKTQKEGLQIVHGAL